jgi:hypothetical protein
LREFFNFGALTVAGDAWRSDDSVIFTVIDGEQPIT